MEPFDLRVYLVTRPFLPKEGGFARLCGKVEDALESGMVGAVQLRDKSASNREFANQAATLLQICRQYRARFIINDRVAVARAVGADGVHLGQSDMPAPAARLLLGSNAIIGVSVRTPGEARQAALNGATYVAANGVFATKTKPDAGPPLNLAGVTLLKAARLNGTTLVAIGGITTDNAVQVALAGADGVACVSAILEAKDIAATCRALRAKVLAGRALRLPQPSRHS